MLMLHKILPLLISPEFILIFLALINIFWPRRIVSVTILSSLILLSNPFLANLAYRYLERNYSINDIDNIGKFDGAIVLSGMVRVFPKGDNEFSYEFNELVDRYMAAIKLFEAGKVSHIYFTRGKMPWNIGLSQGDYLLKEAKYQGIPIEKITLTGVASTTEEEATEVSKVLRPGQKLLLITSAFHMDRALHIFNAKGIKVTPFAVDFRSNSLSRLKLFDLLPSAYAFFRNSQFLREMLGRAYYKLKL